MKKKRSRWKRQKGVKSREMIKPLGPDFLICDLGIVGSRFQDPRISSALTFHIL